MKKGSVAMFAVFLMAVVIAGAMLSSSLFTNNENSAAVLKASKIKTPNKKETRKSTKNPSSVRRYTPPSGPGDLPGGKMLPYTPPSGPGDIGDSGQARMAGSRQSGYGPYWYDNGTDWVPMSNPPACAEPFTMQPPIDFSRVTSVLYPGQYRGSQYKPHGGFRFDNNNDNNVSVKIPLDAMLIHGSRYGEGGEVQYLFTFVAPCGIMYRFDHLLTLTPKFQAIADTLPQPKEGDSRTTNLNKLLL